MNSARKKTTSTRSKQIVTQNKQLQLVPITISHTVPTKIPITAMDPLQVMQEAELLWIDNEETQAINLLAGLVDYLKGTKFGNREFLTILHTNLAVCYLRIDILPMAQEQFAIVTEILKELADVPAVSAGLNLHRTIQQLKYNMLQTRIQLQTCIIFSQASKHEEAQKSAFLSCKIAYNIIYDLQMAQYQCIVSILNKNRNCKTTLNPMQEIMCTGYQNLINNISIIEQLISSTKDMKRQFISKQKLQLFQEERMNVLKMGKIPTKINLEMLYYIDQNNLDALWVYKNKILDQIQMKFIEVQYFHTRNHNFSKNSQVIEKFVFLVISLYCYSTESRFLQNKQRTEDPTQVLDSEHWLSRSLEIAYSFLPQEAPILNQILNIHDRFHGIDKQTIPEDKEVGGFFKVLRPLSQPKSNYSNKNTMCSPIMIRIQVPKLSIEESKTTVQKEEKNEQSPRVAIKTIDFMNKTINLQAMTKNYKIRGLNMSKKYDLSEESSSAMKHRKDRKIDIPHHQNLKAIYSNTRKIQSTAEHNNRSHKMKIKYMRVDGYEQIYGLKGLKRPHSYSSGKESQKTEMQTQRKKKISSSLTMKEEQRKRVETFNIQCYESDEMLTQPTKIKQNKQADSYESHDEKVQNGEIQNREKFKKGNNIFINKINFCIKENRQQQKEKGLFEICKRHNFFNKNTNHQSSKLTEVKNPQLTS